jgi:hypothetical protein
MFVQRGCALFCDYIKRKNDVLRNYPRSLQGNSIKTFFKAHASGSLKSFRICSRLPAQKWLFYEMCQTSVIHDELRHLAADDAEYDLRLPAYSRGPGFQHHSWINRLETPILQKKTRAILSFAKWGTPIYLVNWCWGVLCQISKDLI